MLGRMEEGLKPVSLTALPGKPRGHVDERTGEIFVSPAAAGKLRRAGCVFATVDVYVDGRWRNLILGSHFGAPT